MTFFEFQKRFPNEGAALISKSDENNTETENE